MSRYRQPQQPPTVSAVVRAACDEFKVHPRMLASQYRGRKECAARNACALVMYRTGIASLHDIAAILNRTAHTTALTMRDAAKSRAKRSPEYAARIERVEMAARAASQTLAEVTA